MEQVRTNWLQKAVAIVAGIVLAACLAICFAPAKAWAASPTLVTAVNITGYQAPAAGDNCASNAAALQYAYTPQLQAADIISQSASWYNSDGTSATTFEADKSYYLQIVIKLKATVDSDYAFDGVNGGKVYAGSVNFDGPSISSAEATPSTHGSQNDILTIKTELVTVSDGSSSLYKMTSGDGATWTKGSTDSLVFKTNQDFDEFQGVEIDGVSIEKDKDYTAESGSIVVTLKPSYLETLSAGTHTISVYAFPEVGPRVAVDDDADTFVTGTFTVKEAGTADDEEAAADESTGANDTTKSPKTGVETAPLAATTLVFALGALAAGAFILRTRKEGVK